MNQRTSQVIDKPVSAGLARTIGQMVDAAALKYNGGSVRMELVKGDPEFQAALFQLWDQRSNERAKVIAIQDRPVWKVVQSGTNRSNAERRTTLLDGGFKISQWGGDILNKVPVVTEPIELPLVLVSGLDLGLTGTPTRKQIFDAGLATGILDLCPAWVGPELRQQYPEQPKGEWSPIAMEPITDSDGDLGLFYLGRDDDDLWLNAFYGHPDIQWNADDRWVFVRK